MRPLVAVSAAAAAVVADCRQASTVCGIVEFLAFMCQLVNEFACKAEEPHPHMYICVYVCVWIQLTVRPIRNLKYFRIIVYISISFLLGIESQNWLLVCLPVVCLSVNLSACLSVSLLCQPTDWLIRICQFCLPTWCKFDNFGCTFASSAIFLWHKKRFFTDSQLHRNNKSSYGDCIAHILQLKSSRD